MSGSDAAAGSQQILAGGAHPEGYIQPQMGFKMGIVINLGVFVCV